VQPALAKQEVECGDLGRQSQRVVPGQNRDHCADIHAARCASDVGQELNGIGDHNVRRKVVLDCPHRVETMHLGTPNQRQRVVVQGT
jgi:hypothetical protein